MGTTITNRGTGIFMSVVHHQHFPLILLIGNIPGLQGNAQPRKNSRELSAFR